MGRLRLELSVSQVPLALPLHHSTPSSCEGTLPRQPSNEMRKKSCPSVRRSLLSSNSPLGEIDPAFPSLVTSSCSLFHLSTPNHINLDFLPSRSPVFRPCSPSSPSPRRPSRSSLFSHSRLPPLLLPRLAFNLDSFRSPLDLCQFSSLPQSLSRECLSSSLKVRHNSFFPRTKNSFSTPSVEDSR